MYIILCLQRPPAEADTVTQSTLPNSPELILRVAEATAVEVRGKHNDFVKQGDYASHTGIACFSPVINIMRDPRWGRNQVRHHCCPILPVVNIMGRNQVRHHCCPILSVFNTMDRNQVRHHYCPILSVIKIIGQNTGTLIIIVRFCPSSKL